MKSLFLTLAALFSLLTAVQAGTEAPQTSEEVIVEEQAAPAPAEEKKQ